jgi:dephospho-CoA kinase
MMIIGITGTIGAGKGTIVEYLIDKLQFRHFSVRGYISREIERRGMPVNRDSMVVVANDLRAKNSPSFIVDQLFAEASKAGGNSVIESIRTPGEVTSLRKQKNFWLFAVDCDPKIRYERIKARASETDKVDFETFLENEKREMTADDPNKQNLKKCIEMADFVFDNSGSVDKLYEEVETVLGSLELQV